MVLGKVEEVDSIIKKLPVTESNKAGLESTKELLQRGMALIIRRQKHIKMADHSDNCWAVVQEYKADELADNSDDEKKIVKAERAAEKKAVVAARKRKSTRPFSHQLLKIQKLEQPAVAAAQQPTMQLKPMVIFPWSHQSSQLAHATIVLSMGTYDGAAHCYMWRLRAGPKVPQQTGRILCLVV